jgi:hypothetical protein
MQTVAFSVLTLAFLGSALAQSDVTPRARELFYQPPPAQTKTARTSAAAPSPVKPAPRQSDAAVTPAATGAGSAKVIPAALSNVPLAVKYTILKKTTTGYDAVDPDTVFRSGDRIRVKVETNDTAYLYIVMGGSSGTWRVLFPARDIGGGDNLMQKHKEVTIPSGGNTFTFDEQAGTEKVSLILSREPEADLEKLIYAVAGDRPKAGPKTMMAGRTEIDSAIVGQVHEQVLSRDLVFEKTDDKTPEGKPETATYVATPNTGADARLFVDLQLKHQ